MSTFPFGMTVVPVEQQDRSHKRLFVLGAPVIVPGERIIEPCLDDPFPDYDTEPVMAYANG